MAKLIKVIYSHEHRIKWDKGLFPNNKIEPVRDSVKTCYYTYNQYKPQFGMDSRDFYEKAAGFVHEGKYYRYSCFVQ